MRTAFVVFGWLAGSLVMLAAVLILWAGSAEQTAYVDPVPEPHALSGEPGDFNFTVRRLSARQIQTTVGIGLEPSPRPEFAIVPILRLCP